MKRSISYNSTVSQRALKLPLNYYSEAGFIRKGGTPVVILGNGEITVALKVRVHRVSKTAKAKIEAAGGSVETL